MFYLQQCIFQDATFQCASSFCRFFGNLVPEISVFSTFRWFAPKFRERFKGWQKLNFFANLLHLLWFWWKKLPCEQIHKHHWHPLNYHRKKASRMPTIKQNIWFIQILYLSPSMQIKILKTKHHKYFSHSWIVPRMPFDALWDRINVRSDWVLVSYW